MKFLTNLALSALAVFAPIKAVLVTVAVLVLADLILGIASAVKMGSPVTSAGFRRTLTKLVVYEVAVALGFLCESFLTGASVPISKIISAYIGLTEMKSISENLNIINGSSIFNDLIKKLGSQNDDKKDSKRMKKAQLPIKRIIAATMAMVMLATMVMHGPSENYLRSRAVKLSSPRGSCSGVQIHAPSGMDYILSAAHCKVLTQDGSILTIAEDGKQMMRRVIQEDDASDLLLLEGMPSMRGLQIADINPRLNHVRTFTHGRGLDTYKTEGRIIQDVRIQVLVGIIGQEDVGSCSGEKYKRQVIDLGFIEGEACIMDVVETITDAMITPGSSGGPIVDDSGRLVGIVSAGDGTFGCLVRLQDIQKFISNY